jgi:agmatine deiminase
VENVHVLVRDADTELEVREMLAKSGARMEAVEFFICPMDRSWTRDYCPTFVADEAGKVTALDWRFNGWAKYDNYEADDAVPLAIAGRAGIPRVEPEFRGRKVVLEGGSIDLNGSGVMLTTEECLLSDVQVRNPDLGRGDYEAIFAEYLGCHRTVWLKNGIAGDDTHGHIDDLARFVDEKTIVLAVEEDPKDENFEPLQQNLRILQETEFRIVPLPMPSPVWFDQQRLPASYANFYIANGLVLVPTFNDAKDHEALGILSDVFPDRQVVGIHSRDLVLGLGTLHCMTQQQIAR